MEEALQNTALGLSIRRLGAPRGGETRALQIETREPTPPPVELETESISPPDSPMDLDYEDIESSDDENARVESTEGSDPRRPIYEALYIDKGGNPITLEDIMKAKREKKLDELLRGARSLVDSLDVPRPVTAPWAKRDTADHPKAVHLKRELVAVGCKVLSQHSMVQLPTLSNLVEPNPLGEKVSEGMTHDEAFPGGLPLLDDRTYPTFHQNSILVHPSPNVAISAANLIRRGEGDGQMDLAEECRTISVNNVKGTSGQGNIPYRLRKQLETRAKAGSDAERREPGTMARAMLEAVTRKDRVAGVVSLDPMKLNTVTAIRLDSGKAIKALALHPGSSAGPIMQDAKQGEVAAAILNNAWTYYNTDKLDRAAQVCYAKQKLEVYPEDKFKATRIISVRSAGVELCANTVVRLFNNCAGNFLDGGPSKSMKGINMLSLEPNIALDKLLSGELPYLHYADNVFCVKRGFFYSLDASSFESSHSDAAIEAALTAITAFVGNGEIDKLGRVHKAVGLSQKSRNFLLGKYLESLINSISLAGVVQYKTPGMPSGTAITFLVNDLVMSYACQQSMGPDDIDECIRRFQENHVVMKVSKKIDVQDIKNLGEGEVLDTDMLGFSITKVEGKTVTVLEPERMLKSLTFYKEKLPKELDEDERAERSTRNLISLCVSCLLNGAPFIDALGRNVIETLNRAVKTLEERGASIEFEMTEVKGKFDSQWAGRDLAFWKRLVLAFRSSRWESLEDLTASEGPSHVDFRMPRPSELTHAPTYTREKRKYLKTGEESEAAWMDPPRPKAPKRDTLTDNEVRSLLDYLMPLGTGFTYTLKVPYDSKLNTDTLFRVSARHLGLPLGGLYSREEEIVNALGGRVEVVPSESLSQVGIVDVM